jgi:uracil-DNA glycosylase
VLRNWIFAQSYTSRRVFHSSMVMASLKRKAADLAADDAKKPKANGSITSFFGQPKPNPNASSTNPAKEPLDPAPAVFDKEAWIEKLTDEQKELLKLEIDTLHESWLGVLKDDVKSKEFLDLKRFLKKEIAEGKKVFPPMEDVYSWYDSNEFVSGFPITDRIH